VGCCTRRRPQAATRGTSPRTSNLTAAAAPPAQSAESAEGDGDGEDANLSTCGLSALAHGPCYAMLTMAHTWQSPPSGAAQAVAEMVCCNLRLRREPREQRGTERRERTPVQLMRD